MKKQIIAIDTECLFGKYNKENSRKLKYGAKDVLRKLKKKYQLKLLISNDKN